MLSNLNHCDDPMTPIMMMFATRMIFKADLSESSWRFGLPTIRTLGLMREQNRVCVADGAGPPADSEFRVYSVLVRASDSLSRRSVPGPPARPRRVRVKSESVVTVPNSLAVKIIKVRAMESECPTHSLTLSPTRRYLSISLSIRVYLRLSIYLCLSLSLSSLSPSLSAATAAHNDLTPPPP
jgi:hypothetical protein